MKGNNLSKNTILLAIGTFLNKGLLFVMIPLFSRWLSTEDFGRFDVFCTYVTLIIPIVTLACNEAVFRFGIEKDKDIDKGKYITNGLAIVLVNTLFMGIILIIVYSIKGAELLFPFFLMASTEIINIYLQGYMRAIRKLNIYSFCSAFSTLCIAVGVTFFVLFMNMGLKGMIYGYALGYLVGDIAIIIVTKFTIYFDIQHFNFNTIKEMVAYSYVLIPNNISWWIINVSDRTIINLFLGASFNGIYAIASKIPNFCTALFGVFGISWQETATDMISDNNRDNYYSDILNKMCKILISLCGAIVCCNFIFFDIIFDLRYSTGRFYTPILITSAIFSSLSQYFGGIQISLKKPKANGISTMFGAVVNLIVHFALVNVIGLYAAAISTLVSNMVITITRVVLLNKDIKFSVDKGIVKYIIIYLYFFIFSYVKSSMVFDIANLLIAAVVFIYVNKELLKKITRRMLRYN